MVAKLVLETGEEFPGYCPAWQIHNFQGEVVFTTGMTGYVESLTDPSYKEQILVFTYPLIGNYGVPDPSTWESQKIQVKGVITCNPSYDFSHHTAKTGFLQWLEKENIPLLYGIDTRALTKRLRTQGSTLGAIQCSDEPLTFSDPNDTHLVKEVSIAEKKVYGNGKKTVIAVDCGMKENILRCLIDHGLRVIRVPFDYDYTNDDYDGVFLSNGPGNPEKAHETIAILQKALKRKKPTFGICLGSQLLSLAIGGKTYKLKFGHRGHNQPCYDHEQKRCILTSQNHGYAVSENTLPKDWKVLFTNVNDSSVEGIAHKKDPFFAVQFHPESAPGPNDAHYLFKRFCDLL